MVEDGQGRRHHPRRHHPPGPGLQPGRAGHRPHHVRRHRHRRALPAQEVLRRGPQRRGGWLAHHPGHRAGRDRLARWTRSIFEEFKGTGQHGAAPRPPGSPSGASTRPSTSTPRRTRHEELLFDRKQLQQVWKLRRVLSGLAADGNAGAGLELLIDRLKTFRTNDEFLAEIAKAPGVPRPEPRVPSEQSVLNRAPAADMTGGQVRAILIRPLNRGPARKPGPVTERPNEARNPPQLPIRRVPGHVVGRHDPHPVDHRDLGHGHVDRRQRRIPWPRSRSRPSPTRSSPDR